LILHIGIDDTDSKQHGCTTYISSLIIKKLLQLKAEFIDYPNLIRLNPNVPWKTKGNAAVALRFKHSSPKTIFNIICNIVEKNSKYIDGFANPGIIMLVANEIPDKITLFSKTCMSKIVKVHTAIKLLDDYDICFKKYGTGQGLIGALAAIGNTLNNDYTYELLSYRKTKNWGTKRHISSSSVINMDKKMQKKTFSNYDYDNNRILITPNSPDPVFCGIRGESCEYVYSSYKMLDINELLDSYVIYRTNQGTNAHLFNEFNKNNIHQYSCGFFSGYILSKPKIFSGGHIYFLIEKNNIKLNCVVYQQSQNLRKISLNLEIGDYIKIGGAIRSKKRDLIHTVNIEYFEILKLKDRILLSNPFCTSCQKRLKSQGKNQPFRCVHCKIVYPKSTKIMEKINRNITTKLYLPPLGSQRHLTKPLHRYGLEKEFYNNIICKNWNIF